MTDLTQINFEDENLKEKLDSLDDTRLDALNFGVIGFDETTTVRKYNASELEMAGLTKKSVLGAAMFVSVAPSLNNKLVAQRFEDALAENRALDATIDYTCVLRARPVKAKLRLLAEPHSDLRYVVVKREAG
ncbi:PAS domain-containing protein [Xylophilus sp. Kf1]|nr:PAS domain-containing protein [Xylophilus sp. Kf1]